MGIVLKGLDPLLRRVVAIKVLALQASVLLRTSHERIWHRCGARW
jgi:hypothetical protein